ncbi:MAG: tRNA (adenosine(37)-N6)-threonylcarbamoyltransferase complex dimerization subunit type 1 TsaB [Pseudomonadales bacterium]
MNVLCIDTSSSHCSVAVAAGERIFCHNQNLARRHNEVLLQILDDLFSEAAITPAQLDLLGFTAGPGSFTGIRMAAAVVQAMAVVAEAQVVPLATNDVLYQTSLAATGGQARAVCSIRSRGDLYYLCEYQAGELTQPLRLTDEPPGWLATENQSTALLGQKPGWWPEHAARFSEQPPDAGTMLHMAGAAHREGLSRSAEFALPQYFEGDSPWRKQTA